MKMTIQEILDLGRMGYTKDDIEKMADPEPKKEEPKQEEPKKESKQEEPEKEEPKKEEPKKEEPAADFSALSASIDALIKTIQASNITKSNNSGADDFLSSEEILGNIIEPPLKKGDKKK